MFKLRQRERAGLMKSDIGSTEHPARKSRSGGRGGSDGSCNRQERPIDS